MTLPGLQFQHWCKMRGVKPWDIAACSAAILDAKANDALKFGAVTSGLAALPPKRQLEVIGEGLSRPLPKLHVDGTLKTERDAVIYIVLGLAHLAGANNISNGDRINAFLGMRKALEILMYGSGFMKPRSERVTGSGAPGIGRVSTNEHLEDKVATAAYTGQNIVELANELESAGRFSNE